MNPEDVAITNELRPGEYMEFPAFAGYRRSCLWTTGEQTAAAFAERLTEQRYDRPAGA